MTPERWQQMKEVLDRAVAIEAAERATYLAVACAGDPELRREVDSLLASHDLVPAGFLEPPLAGGGSLPLGIVATGLRPGTRIGPYLVRERIGRGGMGEVFAAVRADGQYEQQVALKLIRAGLAAPDVVERFRAERQILAGLDHPNIARLLDGGTLDDGVPYLVMEFIDGVPIDTFCRNRGLTVRERLSLFLQACAAVQYAHQRLVIHRDLKPANILVTREGTPKLLDFGIAKMLDPLGATRETALRPFTLEYASPEQVRGEPVSTASDVYALGVVLYQVLTGRLPYTLQTDTSGELAEAIVSRDPDRPHVRELRGDLDAILLKALRKEPDRRYTTVEQFAGDIRRFLEGLPVTARSGTWRYHAAKFVRRHRTAVAAAALVLATLTTGIIVTAREARLADAQRRRADARFNDVRKLANSLIFEIHDSIQNLPGATDARKLILQRSLEYLDSLAKESGNEPDLVRELATAYDRLGRLQSNPFNMSLGDTNGASVSFGKAIAMRESLARANPGSSRDQVELAAAYTGYGEFQAGSVGNVQLGFEYEKRALAILEGEAGKGSDDARVAELMRTCLRTLGLMQIGDGLMAVVGTPTEGVAALERALQLTKQGLERSPEDATLNERVGALEAMIAIGLSQLCDRPAALVHFQRGLAVLEPIARRGDNVVASLNLSVVYEDMGNVRLIDGDTSAALKDYVASEQLSSRIVALDRHNESAQRQETISLVSRGHARVELGEVTGGLEDIRTAVARIEADTIDEPLTKAVEALVRGWYGEALERQGHVREAASQYALTKERLEKFRATANDPRMQGYLAAAMTRLGAAFVKLGETDNARREYDDAVRLVEPLVKAYPQEYEVAYVLAEGYMAHGMLAANRAEHAHGRDEQRVAWREAAGWFRKSLDTWSRVPHPARTSTSGFEVTVPGAVALQLARAEREINARDGRAMSQ